MENPITLESNIILRRKKLLEFPRTETDGFYDLLREVLNNDSSEVIRHEVAFILGSLKSQKALEILLKALNTDKSDLVRHEIIEAIGDIGIANQEAINILSQLTNDGNPFIKETAFIALGTIKENNQSINHTICQNRKSTT